MQNEQCRFGPTCSLVLEAALTRLCPRYAASSVCGGHVEKMLKTLLFLLTIGLATTGLSRHLQRQSDAKIHTLIVKVTKTHHLESKEINFLLTSLDSPRMGTRQQAVLALTAAVEERQYDANHLGALIRRHAVTASPGEATLYVQHFARLLRIPNRMSANTYPRLRRLIAEPISNSSSLSPDARAYVQDMIASSNISDRVTVGQLLVRKPQLNPVDRAWVDGLLNKTIKRSAGKEADYWKFVRTVVLARRRSMPPAGIGY
jgi:hypothetical protein